MRRTALLVAAACLAATGALAQPNLPTAAPDGVEPLGGEEIRLLLGGGRLFNFVGVGMPIRGTAFWDPVTRTAHGRYEIDGRIKGQWNLVWYIEGDTSCVRHSETQAVCSQIYPHGPGGFMEVYPNGKVHALYTPVAAQPLAVELTAQEIRHLLSQFLVWNQQTDYQIRDIRSEGGLLIAEIKSSSGAPNQSLAIDPATGTAVATPTTTPASSGENAGTK